MADPPGRAFIRQESERVVKGDALTLTCEVYPDYDDLIGGDDDADGGVGGGGEDLGRPEAVEFVWTRGGHVVNHVRGREWTMDPVTVEAEANISCVAANAVGRGGEDFIQVDVLGESERKRKADSWHFLNFKMWENRQSQKVS